MSLMGTLAKVAIGVAVAKGVSSMAGGRSGGTSAAGGLADMMGGLLGGSVGGTSRKSSGGIGDLLQELGGAAMGGSRPTRPRRTSSPDLGGLLGQLTGAGGGASPGGIGDLIGALAGAGAAGGLGGLLGGIMGSGAGSLGPTLNSAFANGGEPDQPPAPEQELAAAVMLAAMIQAAKSDGQIDTTEQGKLMTHLGEVGQQEMAFVQAQLAAPVDVPALIAQVPEGMEAQVYLVSLMAIDLDSQPEAHYLHQLATGLGLQPAEVNQIHDRIGVAKLYA